ncbi:MAG: hypothetical protein QG588_678 [Candidatus Poribacteria bacterium]|nr:hypothetical protein [Candidatus Poribacteria bacterium]
MAVTPKTSSKNAGRKFSSGEVTFKKLILYNDKKLKEYFRDRLSERVLNPSLNISNDEVPEDFVVGFYQSGEEKSKTICKKIVKELLVDEINDGSNGNHYLSRLLYLCDMFVIEEALEIVYETALRERFINQQGCYGDIHEQLLKNLIFMQDTGTQDTGIAWTQFWLSYVQYPLYTGVAFIGLCKTSLDMAIEKLPVLVKAASESPEKYDLKLMIGFFIDICGGGESFLPRMGKGLKYASPDIKRKILAVVTDLKYSPQAIKEFERSMDCVGPFANKLVNKIEEHCTNKINMDCVDCLVDKIKEFYNDKINKAKKDRDPENAQEHGIKEVILEKRIMDITGFDPTCDEKYLRHRSEIADMLKQSNITLSPNNICSTSIGASV